MAILATPELIQSIRRYKAGDQAAFEEIYTGSIQYVTKSVLNVLNRTAPGASEDLKQDIIQDTYLTIATKLDTLQTEQAFLQWAGQIATNHALRTWKKDVQQHEQEQPEDEQLLELPDERFIPEDILENKEKQLLIRKMLQELPTNQYLCLVEYFYNGLKEAQIAQKLDMPLGTVKTNLSRAKKKLKAIVETHEKKSGVKLYSMAWLLLVLFWKDIRNLFVDPQVAKNTLDGVSKQIRPISAAKGAVSASAKAAAAGTKVAAAGAKAGMSLGAKIVAGVVAGAIALGLGAGAVFAGGKLLGGKGSGQPKSIEGAEPTSVIELEAGWEVPGGCLTPEDVEFFERVICMLGSEGSVMYFDPREDMVEALHREAVSVIRCSAGEDGWLEGKPGINGKIRVSMEDARAFCQDMFGVVPESFEYLNVITEANGEYLQISPGNLSSKDKGQILNAKWLDHQTLLLTAYSYKKSLAVVAFVRNPESDFGWTILCCPDNWTVDPECEENTLFRHSGIPYVEVLQPLMGGKYLSEAGARAYAQAYWYSTREDNSCKIRIESYFDREVYEIYYLDENGETLERIRIDGEQLKLWQYDGEKDRYTELDWVCEQ